MLIRRLLVRDNDSSLGVAETDDPALPYVLGLGYLEGEPIEVNPFTDFWWASEPGPLHAMHSLMLCSKHTVADMPTSLIQEAAKALPL